jgi:hypothetical protein
MSNFPYGALISLALFVGQPAEPQEKPKQKESTTVVKAGKATTVVKEIPPVPARCVVTVATTPKLTDDAMFGWTVVPEENIKITTEEPNKLVFEVPTSPEVEYRVKWTAKEPKAKQQVVRVNVKAGKGPRPPPDPDVDPDVDPPQPDGKPLIEDPANRVLIIYETGDQTNYTQGQIGFMYSAEVRQYLSEKCPKAANSNGWYMLDKDAVTTALPPAWGKAMARPRTKLPWMIVSNPKGGWEGPVPERYEDAFAKVKEFIK